MLLPFRTHAPKYVTGTGLGTLCTESLSMPSPRKRDGRGNARSPKNNQKNIVINGLLL